MNYIVTLNNKQKYTDLIKLEAKRLGFISCGISKSGFLDEEAPRFEKWLSNNMNGEMKYMENHFDKRLDTTKLVLDSKSVLSLLYNYYPEKELDTNYKISKYAYGKDYHDVIKYKLNELLYTIKENIGDVSGRAFVDSAPILERAWASKSGLGWVGKNTNLISKKTGSFYFIAELIIDLDLIYDSIETDHCGSCTACIDSCPTDAIVDPYIVDGSKCISYYTIELKDNLPSSLKDKFENWIFGCDICQDVCPWNKFSKPHKEPLFNPTNDLLYMTDRDYKEITLETFNKVFSKSAVKRAKFKGLSRNINFLKQ